MRTRAVVVTLLSAAIGCVPKQPTGSAAYEAASPADRDDPSKFMKRPEHGPMLRHPAQTGSVDPNLAEYDWGSMDGMPPHARVSMMSIVDLTEARLCVEVMESFTNLPIDYKPWLLAWDGNLFTHADTLKHASLAVINRERKIVPKVGTQYTYSESGRTETKCQWAQGGTVCETNPIYNEHRHAVEQTDEVRLTRAQICWDHEGAITPATQFIAISNSDDWTVTPKYSWKLVGKGQPAAKWGGKGGTPLRDQPWLVSADDWGMSTCKQVGDNARKRPRPGAIDVSGDYKCTFGGFYNGLRTFGTLVQGKDGRVRGAFLEHAVGVTDEFDMTKVRWEGIVDGDRIHMFYPGFEVGAELRIEGGGASLNGHGATLIAKDKHCLGYNLTCTKVGPPSADVPAGGSAPTAAIPPTGGARPPKPTTGPKGGEAAPRPTPTTDEVENGLGKPVCIVDAYDRATKHLAKNLLAGALPNGKKAPLQIPKDAAMLRFVSCDKKLIGLTALDHSRKTSFKVLAGPANSFGEIQMMPASSYDGSPFAK